ncbi:hypothetical protein AAOE16_18305 [Ekhidna sp. MALMAid0563]|uniref:hypothetical protein n=1 Tax=Ekhidna sp. MALMAid0563 TaxID=3143937 RepID=UPI0032DECF21
MQNQQNEQNIGIKYQYMANKKSYILGLRVRKIRYVLIGCLVLLGTVGPWLGSVILAIFIAIGYQIDMKQRKMSRNYVASVLTWSKIKGLEARDKTTVLNVFRKTSK